MTAPRFRSARRKGRADGANHLARAMSQRRHARCQEQEGDGAQQSQGAGGIAEPVAEPDGPQNRNLIAAPDSLATEQAERAEPDDSRSTTPRTSGCLVMSRTGQTRTTQDGVEKARDDFGGSAGTNQAGRRFYIYFPSVRAHVQDCSVGATACIIRSPMATPHPLLDRLLKTPDLARVIPVLPPDVLHRVIQACGLEDSTEFVALATPTQLSRILDVDVWHLACPVPTNSSTSIGLACGWTC